MIAEPSTDPLAALGIQPGGRLVREQDLGTTQDGQREVDAPSFTAGPLANATRARRPVDQLQGFPDRAGRGQRPGPHPHRLRHAEFRAKPAFLQDNSNPRTHRTTLAPRVVTQQLHGPNVAGANPPPPPGSDAYPASFVPSSSNSSPRRTEKFTPLTGDPRHRRGFGRHRRPKWHVLRMTGMLSACLPSSFETCPKTCTEN